MARLIESDLRSIRVRIQRIGGMVIRQLELGEVLLEHPDPRLLLRLHSREDHIDMMDNKIHRACQEIIALHQPVANDLRFVFAALHIGLHLEKAGDHIATVSNLTLKLQPIWNPTLFRELGMADMLRKVRDMVEAATTGFLDECPERLKTVIRQDDEVDDTFDQVEAILVAEIQRAPQHSAEYILLLEICNRLEKLGDLAVRISEEALFYLEGRQYRHKHELLQAA